MQLSKELIILAVFVMALIYWTLSDQISGPMQETSDFSIFQGTGEGFFPKAASPPEGAESIKEETFMESP